VIDDQADEAEVDVDGREKLRSASSAGGSLSTRGCAKMVRASAKLAEVRKRRSIYECERLHSQHTNVYDRSVIGASSPKETDYGTHATIVRSVHHKQPSRFHF
jgi:hypothetical protein